MPLMAILFDALHKLVLFLFDRGKYEASRAHAVIDSFGTRRQSQDYLSTGTTDAATFYQCRTYFYSSIGIIKNALLKKKDAFTV